MLVFHLKLIKFHKIIFLEGLLHRIPFATSGKFYHTEKRSQVNSFLVLTISKWKKQRIFEVPHKTLKLEIEAERRIFILKFNKHSLSNVLLLFSWQDFKYKTDTTKHKDQFIANVCFINKFARTPLLIMDVKQWLQSTVCISIKKLQVV